MNQPSTIYEVLAMLADYHQQRAKQYEQLGRASTDPRAEILLEHLVELEEHSIKVIQSEMKDLSPEHSTYLITGPALSVDAMHAAECRCHGEPSFEDSLACALTPDRRLEELFDRIENSSAASTVTELAKRLRDLERIKGQQIAKFTRED
ncbi:MAG: hypothetical protein WD049_06390 [Candidatus Paceibacterota bacterium]